MVITQQHEKTELEETLEWYKNHAEHVDLVYCGSDLGEGCDELLALEVYGNPPGYHKRDERGVIRVVIGPSMRSTRVRFDQHDSGRMIGYQCVCGNDTRLSEAELHHPPKGGWYKDLLPWEPDQIRTSIKVCGQHEASYKEDGNTKHYESFRVERVK